MTVGHLCSDHVVGNPHSVNLSSLGIVVPTLNAAQTLAQTLLSIQPAVVRGAELIVVDGGSKDDTLRIAGQHDAKTLTVDGNMYAALNAGMRLLQTEWFTWINADDLLFCDILADRITAAGAARVAYGPVDFIDKSGRFVHSWASARPKDLLPLYRAGLSPLLQQGTLFHREVFAALDGFRETYRFVGDADFWWRALERGFRFLRTTHPSVAAFRLHGQQLSQSSASEMRAEHTRMVREHGGCRPTLHGYLSATRFRGANFSRYVVRFLRRRDLEGVSRWAGSYALPRGDRGRGDPANES